MQIREQFGGETGIIDINTRVFGDGGMLVQLTFTSQKNAQEFRRKARDLCGGFEMMERVLVSGFDAETAGARDGINQDLDKLWFLSHKCARFPLKFELPSGERIKLYGCDWGITIQEITRRLEAKISNLLKDASKHHYFTSKKFHYPIHKLIDPEYHAQQAVPNPSEAEHTHNYPNPRFTLCHQTTILDHEYAQSTLKDICYLNHERPFYIFAHQAPQMTQHEYNECAEVLQKRQEIHNNRLEAFIKLLHKTEGAEIISHSTELWSDEDGLRRSMSSQRDSNVFHKPKIGREEKWDALNNLFERRLLGTIDRLKEQEGVAVPFMYQMYDSRSRLLPRERSNLTYDDPTNPLRRYPIAALFMNPKATITSSYTIIVCNRDPITVLALYVATKVLADLVAPLCWREQVLCPCSLCCFIVPEYTGLYT